MKQHFFIQIGATRDGLDPYLSCARTRGYTAILVETPDYLALRKTLGRQVFDVELAVNNPSDVESLVLALSAYHTKQSLLLAGFESYSKSASLAAMQLNILPYRQNANAFFIPPDKDTQRRILSEQAPLMFSQPWHKFWNMESCLTSESTLGIEFPCVVKPTTGAGGLGVYLVSSEQALEVVLQKIKQTRNYDGAPFNTALIEQYIEGEELSIQGLAWNGEAILLSACQKIIQKRSEGEGIRSFREAGHLTLGDQDLRLQPLQQVAQQCVSAFQYTNGPFHIDLIARNDQLYFLEMGYRLSGGCLVNLVKKSSGIAWAERVFDLFAPHTTSQHSASTASRSQVGLMTVSRPACVEKALQLNNQALKISIDPIAINLNMIAERSVLAESLRSDYERHGAGIARIWVEGGTNEQLEAAMKDILNV